MDMSDKIAVGQADELEHDRELLRAEGFQPQTAGFGYFARSSVGAKLNMMIGVAGVAVLLAAGALFALGGGTGTGMLTTMTIIGVVVVALGALSIRFVQADFIRPLEEICVAMRELASGSREVDVPHDDRNDELGEMARYLVVIKKAAAKFDRMRLERDEATNEELRRMSEIESEREVLRVRQSETLLGLADMRRSSSLVASSRSRRMRSNLAAAFLITTR